jgi:putative transposase
VLTVLPNMPRPPRIYIPDVSVHVIQRGLNRSAIVADEHDRERLLELIARAAGRHGVSVHGFSLMTTHWHMVATPSGEGVLAKTMQEIGVRYTRYFNRKYERIGTMWNERYTAILLEDERYWYNCLRYVELNAVAARIVAAPEAYRWSTYRVHALGEPCGWLTPHPLYEALGKSAAERQAAYLAMCATPLSDGELALQRCPPPRAIVQMPAEV